MMVSKWGWDLSPWEFVETCRIWGRDDIADAIEGDGQVTPVYGKSGYPKTINRRRVANGEVSSGILQRLALQFCSRSLRPDVIPLGQKSDVITPSWPAFMGPLNPEHLTLRLWGDGRYHIGFQPRA